MSALPEQITLGLRFALAYALIGVLFVLNTVSLSLPFSGEFEIPLLMMAIYYWSIYRPTLIPVWLVFFIGIVFDAVSGIPLGLSAFIFLGLRWIIIDQRLFLMGQSFPMVWVIFSLMTLLTLLVQWGIYGLLHMQWTPIISVLCTILLGVFVFPLISMVLHLTHRILPSLYTLRS